MLTIGRAGTGSGTVTSAPAGIDCGTACVAPFSLGQAITLTATSAQDSVFEQWSGDPDCADGLVTVTGDLQCTAEFRAATVGKPVPFISSVSPLAVTPGSPGFTLVVNGAHFSPDSVVRWNGIDHTPTSVTASRIDVQIAGSEIAAAGTAVVTIATGPPGGGASNHALVHVATSAPALGFLSGTHDTGGQPAAVAAIDLDLDGNPDIVATNAAASSVSVLMGYGDGTFGAKADFATGGSPNALQVADFNHDGRYDLVTANASADTVSVLLGNGNGTFGAASDFGVGSVPSALAVGDFNADGALDVVVADAGGNSVSVLLGIGDGTFKPAADYATGPAPSGVIVGDFNGDGTLDVMTADQGASSLSFFPGVGDGTLGASVVIAAGSGPRNLAAGDFNADGVLDLAVANERSGTVSVLLGNGIGTFSAKSDITVGRLPRAIVLGDVNADGNLDAVVSNGGSDSISVLLGDGSGMFAPPLDFTVGSAPVSLAGADFDRDGRLDFAVADQSAGTVSVLAGRLPGTLSISPSAVDFGLRVVGSPADSQTITITNGGVLALDVTAVALSAGAVSEFEILSDGCTGASIQAQGTCVVDVRYVAATAGSATADLQLASSAPGSPSVIVLSGEAAAIRPRTVAAVVTAADKSYDGTTAAALASCVVTGLVEGDAVGCTGTATFDSANVSTGKTVTVSSLTLTGAAAGNYVLAATTTTTNANIEAGRVTAIVTVADKRYDGTTAATLTSCSVNGVMTGDSVDCTGTVAFDSANAGANKAVAVSNLELTATATANYVLAATTATTTATIRADRPPVVTNPGAQRALQGVAFTLALTAVDADGDLLTWTAQGLPPGITLNPSTGALSGVPSTMGTFTATITASDGWEPALVSVAWSVASPIPGPATSLTPSDSIATTTPTFSWSAVPVASYYAMSIADAGAGSPVVVWFTPVQAGCASGVSTCTVAAPRTLVPGLVTWKVLTWNPYGYGPWSDPRDVVVDVVDPVAPTLATISPIGVIATQNPNYAWTAVAGVTAYRLSIRNNAGQPAYSWYTPAAAGCVAAPTCNATPQPGLRNGTTAQWQVQAWTTRGSGPWTAPVALTVSMAVPRPIPPADQQISAVRLIEYGWDSPSPEFVRAHIGDMERRPFDGVVMGLPDGGGDVFRLDAWNEDTLASQLPILRDIQWHGFDSNFLAMYAASSMDWYDDADWRIVLQHAAFMARAAREGHLKGLMFDPEPYGPSPWTYATQPHASAHTFSEYEAIVRERGRAFMRALQQEYPGLDFLTFYSYSYFLRASVAPGLDARETVLKDQPWGLLPAFLDGMLEVADSNTQIIDGHEQSYYAERPEDFATAAAEVREGAFPYVSSDLWDTYPRHVQGAQPLYLDWIFGYFKTSTPSLGDGLSDDQRAQLAEHHAYYAMKNVDRYVWLYSEKMNWWTGEHLPPGAEDALGSARRKFRSGEDLGFDVTSTSQGAP